MEISNHRIAKSFLLTLCVIGLAGILTTGAHADSFSYKDYAATLKAYVNDKGLVSYKALKSDSKRLDAFVSSLETVKPEEFVKWTDKQKIAFWINAYNALTLKAIIDHYPIDASFFKSLIYPRNSIRQISGVWTELQFPVMGQDMTLDQIEHETLRARFNEPRIHVALVCAAMSCPILRNEPYMGATLDAQLDDQAAKFVKDSKNFRIDRGAGKVYLSSIFKWFGEDFVKKYGVKDGFGELGEAEKAVLNFVSRYLQESEKAYLKKGGFTIAYIDYDWSLNEKAA